MSCALLYSNNTYDHLVLWQKSILQEDYLVTKQLTYIHKFKFRENQSLRLQVLTSVGGVWILSGSGEKCPPVLVTLATLTVE